MLNKEVCAKCWGSKKTYTLFSWKNKADRIRCKHRPAYLHIESDPPDECPYKLEHMVTNQDAE